MRRLILTLNEDLVLALQELADWEGLPELRLATELVQLALHKALPQREERHRFASLTERERQLCWLLQRGLTRQQIAEQLYVTPLTVKTHLRNIRIKLGLQTIAEIRKFLDKMNLSRFDKIDRESADR